VPEVTDGKRAAHMVPVPEGRARRVSAALEAVHAALGLAQREAEGAAVDAGRLRWAALGLVSALQGALVAALSGYETAEVDAVLDPSHPERIAPVALLLRRARSEEFLNPPERPETSGSDQRAIERVMAVRNAAVHALPAGVPESFASDAARLAALIRHLVIEAPAFDPAPLRVVTALISDELRGVQKALSGAPRD
jgi:hypothetical protein